MRYSKQDKQFKFWIQPQQLEYVANRAKEEDISYAEVMRRLINEAMKNQSTK